MKWPRFERDAADNIESVIEYLARANLSRCQRFKQAFNRALRKIAKSPRQFSRLETNTTDQEMRRVILERFCYLIIFKMEHDAPVVAAIMHASQEPNAWRREDSND